MKQAAYSVLEIKSVGTDEQRTISGVATSVVPDRVGDVIVPGGVQMTGADIPLFMYHDATKTIGRARLGKPTADGSIPFEATLPKVTEPGALKDRVDEAWDMLRHRLITCVSVGFRVIDNAVERIAGGGTRFLRTEILELSIVPLPMHPSATIDVVRAADLAIQRAHHANARNNQGSTTMRQAAMLGINSNLELSIDVVGGEKSLSQSLCLQLTRISAQHLADELVSFATGRKSVDGGRQVGVALEVLPARPARQQVVKLGSAAPSKAPRPGVVYVGTGTSTGKKSGVVYLDKTPRKPVVRLR